MARIKTKQFTLRLPAELAAQLEALASDRGESQQAILSLLVERGLSVAERDDWREAIQQIKSAFAASEEKQLGRLEKLVTLINKALGAKG
jgi:predicted DNA-binding protein